LQSDLLLLSGGVSAGKYDLVEKILGELGAEFYFDSVAIRPGKPVVFGRAQDKFFFGLPGNPISTYVTFELFALPTITMLSGAKFEPPLFLAARLARAVRRREGLTAFIPARVLSENGAPVVSPVEWQGSGDIAGFAAANCFIVVHPDRDPPKEGDWTDLMPKMR
jgi:molybdopterin molybdotransferase